MLADVNLITCVIMSPQNKGPIFLMASVMFMGGALLTTLSYLSQKKDVDELCMNQATTRFCNAEKIGPALILFSWVVFGWIGGKLGMNSKSFSYIIIG